MVDNLVARAIDNQTRELARVNRTLSQLERNTRKTPTVSHNDPSTAQNGTVAASFPVELDWASNYPVRTKAELIRRVDGRLTFVIEIVGEDAAIVEDQLVAMDVQALQLSVVDP